MILSPDASAAGLQALSVSDATNFITILMCIAVLVQSVRMMRSLKAMRESALAEAAQALDRATAAANHVLGELKRTLKEDSQATADALRDGAELREELIVMVGIANSVAERLVETNGTASATIAAAAQLASLAPRPAETDTATQAEPVEAILEPDEPGPDEKPFSLKMPLRPYPAMAEPDASSHLDTRPDARTDIPAPVRTDDRAGVDADDTSAERTVNLSSIVEYFR